MEEKTIEQKPESLAIKAKGRLKAFVYSATHEAEKVPLDQLTAPTIADLITKNDWQYPFSIVDILRAFGYVAPWRKTDYREAFPDEYQKTRSGLAELSSRGGLKTIPLEKPDNNKETINYQRLNSDILKNFANLVPKNKPV